MPSLRDELDEQARIAQAELDAIEKAKIRAVKEKGDKKGKKEKKDS